MPSNCAWKTTAPACPPRGRKASGSPTAASACATATATPHGSMFAPAKPGAARSRLSASKWRTTSGTLDRRVESKPGGTHEVAPIARHPHAVIVSTTALIADDEEAPRAQLAAALAQ